MRLTIEYTVVQINYYDRRTAVSVYRLLILLFFFFFLFICFYLAGAYLCGVYSIATVSIHVFISSFSFPSFYIFHFLIISIFPLYIFRNEFNDVVISSSNASSNTLLLPGNHSILPQRRIEKEDMTDFVAKKREMFLVQMSLDTKRDEVPELSCFLLLLLLNLYARIDS